MSPPISKDDLDAVVALLEKRERDRKAPVVRPRFEAHETLAPAVAKKFSESQHELDGTNAGLAKFVERLAYVVNDSNERAARTEEAIARIAIDMQPRAMVALTDTHGRVSERPASVVAAESSVRTEGTANQIQGQAKALQVGVDRSDTQSLAAAKWSKRNAIATGIVGVLTAIVIGAWKIYEAVAH